MLSLLSSLFLLLFDLSFIILIKICKKLKLTIKFNIYYEY